MVGERALDLYQTCSKCPATLEPGETNCRNCGQEIRRMGSKSRGSSITIKVKVFDWQDGLSVSRIEIDRNGVCIHLLGESLSGRDSRQMEGKRFAIYRSKSEHDFGHSSPVLYVGVIESALPTVDDSGAVIAIIGQDPTLH